MTKVLAIIGGIVIGRLLLSVIKWVIPKLVQYIRDRQYKDAAPEKGSEWL